MSDNKEILAATLLGAAVPSELVAVALYQCVSLKEKTPRQATALPSAYALATAKDDGWQAAAMQAMSAVDPAVISTLARDRRVRVLLALAENPNLPPAVANDLWTWINAPDRQTDFSDKAYTNVARIVELDLLMASLPENPRVLRNVQCSPECTRIITSRVFASGSDAYYDILLAASGSLREEVIRRTLLGDAPHSLDELTMRFPEAHRCTLVRAIVIEKGVTRETLEMLVENNMVGSTATARSLEVSDEVFDDVLALDPSAPENKDLYTLVLRSKKSPEHAGALMRRLHQDTAQNDCVTPLKRLLYRNFEGLTTQLSALELLELLDVVIDPDTIQKFSCAIVEKCRLGTTDKSTSMLDHDDLLRVMREVSTRCVEEWLEGKLILKPRPGDVFSLVRTHPDYKRQSSGYWNLYGAASTENPEYAKEILLAGTMSLVRLCTKARVDQDLAELLNQIVSEALGDNPLAWLALVDAADGFYALLEALTKARERSKEAGVTLPLWDYENQPK
jgi:hypothetical protein